VHHQTPSSLGCRPTRQAGKLCTALAALACVALSGCSMFGSSPPLKVETVAFQVSPHAN
jgi:hypothetical protein